LLSIGLFTDLCFEVLFVERSEAQNRKRQFGYKNAAIVAARYADFFYKVGKKIGKNSILLKYR